MRARLVCVGLVGLMAMLAAARAHADWRTGPSLSRPPNDVLDVWGVGTYAVGYDDSTRGGAYVVVDGGTVRDLPTPMANTLAVGTFYQPVQQCFVLLASDGRRSTLGPDDAGCGGINPNQVISYSGSYVTGETFRRVKHAPGGGAIVVAGVDETSVRVFVSDAGIHVPGVNFVVVSRDDTAPLEPNPSAVARVDGGVHFFVGLSSSANAPRAMRGSIDPKTDLTWSYFDWTLGMLRAAELFPAAGRAEPLVVLGTRSALLQGDPSLFTGDPGAVRMVEQLPPGQELVGLSMNVGAGSDAGEGFGMALVRQPGVGLRVLSPVPAGSQTDAGTVWRERVLPPGAGRTMAKVSEVACHGAAYCVLTAPGEAADNLFVYTNAAKPVLAVDGGPLVRVDAGWVELDEDSSATLSLGAIDPDGDPVRVTARHEDVLPLQWTVGAPSTAPGEPVGVPVTVDRVCERTRVGRFQVRASDGWKEHDLQEDVDVYVKHTRQPSPPDVTRGDGGLVPRGSGFVGELAAGGPVVTLTSTGTLTSDGCGWRGRSWTQPPDGGPRLELRDNNTTAILHPPDTFCVAGGSDFSFVLEATDQGGLTVPRTLTVRQQPWGRPERVFAASPVATALAEPPLGVPVTVQPDPRRHACQDAPDFPGVVTSWTVTQSDGGVPDGGYLIQTLLGDGGPDLQTFPVETAGLVLRAQGCQAESVLTVRAAHRVASSDGGPFALGPESQREVRIPPGWQALSQGMIQVSEPPGALGLSSALNCGAERGLSAVLWLSSDTSGETTPRQTVPLPADWPLPRDLECGDYTLHAVLKDSTGEGSNQTTYKVELPGAGVQLEALAPEIEVKAECGQGASFPVSDLVRPTAGSCQTPRYGWTQGGDVLEQVSPRGAPLRLATVSRELNDLIGQRVKVTVEASKGREKTQQSAQVFITTEPFVRVERRTELPAAGETGLVGVLVRLTNTTPCDVREVDYVERLEGLSFVADSARLDGETVDAGTAEDRLTLVLPLLEGGATRTLSYVARPHLLGERRMEGDAKKNKVLLSMSDTGEPPREGCGCTSAGAAPMLLGLALLGALSRRRPTARS